jgi:hypothetical protein
MFTNWLLALRYKQMRQILVGARALYWSIWKSRNGIIFDNSSVKTYMQHIGVTMGATTTK